MDRPGGGPQGDGPGAQRSPNDVQRALYNVWSPNRGQRSRLHHRRLWARLTSREWHAYFQTRTSISAVAELGECMIFVDSAYRGGNHSHCAFNRTDPVLNGQMKRVHISIEWNCMTTVSVFPFIGTEHKFKVFESSGVARIYIVATSFKNFHAALYGNQTMNHFGVILLDGSLQLEYFYIA